MAELNTKLQEYAIKFGDGFPMIPVGMGRSDEEIIEIVDRCLKENKDVYDLGYVDDNPEIYY